MMTSTLPTNNHFDGTSLNATTFYGRPSPFRGLQAESTLSGTVLGSNIWQPNFQRDTAGSRDQAFRHGETSRHPNLRLVPPNTEKTTPIFSLPSKARLSNASDSGDIRHFETTSTQSRSQPASTLLTPTSVTSQSKTDSQRGQQSQERKTEKQPNLGLQPLLGRPEQWPFVKEFQPSYSPFQPGSSLSTNVDPPRNVLGASSSLQHKYTQNDRSLEQIWSQGSVGWKQPYDCMPNGYRPILATKACIADGTPRYNLVGGGRDVLSAAAGEITDRFQSLQIGQGTPIYRADLSTTSHHDQKLESATSQTDLRGHKSANIHNYSAWKHNFREQKHSSALRNFNEPQLLPSTSLPGLPTPAYLSRISSGAFSQCRTSENSSINGRQPRQAHNSCHDRIVQAHDAPSYYTSLYTLASNGQADFRLPYHAYDSTTMTQYGAADPEMEFQTDMNNIVRSPLLEDFRLNGKTKKYELRDIYDHIVEFSGDQLGSRFIQHKLEIANSDEKDRVFKEIAMDSRQLMTDVFGNYVIQKMFEHGNQSQKKVLASHMKGHVYTLSTQTYGCRVVQKALEHVLTDQQASLIRELEGRVLQVVENQNGNHVIQKAIERVPGEHIQFIVDAHIGHVHYLSKHPYGCRVIQRMLEYCTPISKRQVLDELHVNIGDLIQDAFGNYVVQHVIVNGERKDRVPVIDKVQSRLLENAMHKFASNVVEKALDYAEEGQRQAMLRKLTGRDEHGQSQVMKLLSHQYGNYVIQKCAAHLQGHALHSLLEEMEQHLMQLRRVSNGKQVTALEGAIREARQRLLDQHYENPLNQAPTQPRPIAIRR